MWDYVLIKADQGKVFRALSEEMVHLGLDYDNHIDRKIQVIGFKEWYQKRRVI